jgi:hypothetical protein
MITNKTKTIEILQQNIENRNIIKLSGGRNIFSRSGQNSTVSEADTKKAKEPENKMTSKSGADTKER